MVSINRPKFDEESQQYKLDGDNRYRKYYIKQYNPIRLLISKSRNSIRITLNCFVVDDDNNLLIIS